ncbi:metallophosphoesterase [Terasakiella sp. A23]|uniref:metallophosphoesterase n=1 Tax=Terasakiella sp. FCG-A23 TaxID=3080561 RepID=UPI002954015A|nr:metallophosphoesterase [Terasakiella sp. A23]MDV7341430.1 metallophosphoesterase [Terasakiella sp. A23]
MEIIRKAFAIPGSPEEEVALVAIGDVHGRFDLLQQIITTAKKAIPKSAKRVDFVLLGDIIDRGDAAIEVLDLTRDGIEDWNIICLLGNHEQLLLRVLAASDDSYKSKWIMWRGNGGLNTLENLQIKIPPIAEIPVTEHRNYLLDALGQDRIDYLNTFASHHQSGNIVCVHGGVDPKLSLEENFSKDKLSQEENHWAWIRTRFLEHTLPYPGNTFVVHGHTVIPGPKLEPHRIGLDTGACIYGVLSGAVFYNNQMTIFQVTAD